MIIWIVLLKDPIEDKFSTILLHDVNEKLMKFILLE